MRVVSERNAGVVSLCGYYKECQVTGVSMRRGGAYTSAAIVAKLRSKNVADEIGR